MKDNQMDEHRHIGRCIRTLNNLMVRDMENSVREISDGQLTVMHSWIIRYLFKSEEDRFQKDIEEEFHIARSTATNVLQLMEKKGYLTRETVPYDERMKKIVLTEKAIALDERIHANIKRKEAELRIGLTEEDIRNFLRITDQIRTNIEKG